MNKLSGAAAEARLANAWERVFDQDPATQQIIHVLTRPTEYPTWLTHFPPFDAWIRSDRQVNDEVWHTFADIAASWPYIHNARRVIAAGISRLSQF